MCTVLSYLGNCRGNSYCFPYNRSLGAEVLFNLASGSKNINESLTRFGVGDEDKALLAVIAVDSKDDDNSNLVEAVVRRIKGRVRGKMVPVEELDKVIFLCFSFFSISSSR